MASSGIFKWLKWILVLVGFLLLAAVLLPILFKKQVVAKIAETASKQINGKLEFGDVDLTLFKHFPSFTAAIVSPKVTSYVAPDSSVLFSAKSLDITMSFWQLFKLKSGVQINGLHLYDGFINIQQYADSTANYQIYAASPDTGTVASEPLMLKLENYELVNCTILYNDHSVGGMNISIKGLTHAGNGNFGNNLVHLNTTTTIDSISASAGLMTYLKQAQLNLKLDLDIDQQQNLFTIRNHALKLNEFNLDATGKLKLMEDDGIDMDLKFSSPQNQFKNLFSLIPHAYTKDYASVKADGSYLFEGSVKGLYHSLKEIYPSWNILLDVKDGFVQYPGMPANLQKIQFHLLSSNTGPVLDQMNFQIDPLQLFLNQKPIRAAFHLDRLTKDPHVVGFVSGAIDFEDFKSVMPLEPQVQLKGQINADIKFDATQAQVEAEDYENMKMEGACLLRDVYYSSPGTPAISITNMSTQFSPQKAVISDSKMQLGKSDLALSGQINNPLKIIVGKGKTSVNLQMQSSFVDANEWMSDEASSSGSATTANGGSSDDLGIFDQLDLTAKADVGKLAYDNYTISQMSSNVKYNDDKLDIEQLKMVVNENSVNVKGQLTNLMGYALINRKLNGNMTINGNSFNLDKLMAEESSTQSAATPTEETAFVLPGNMDMNFQFSFSDFKYDKLILKNFSGSARLVDQQLEMHDLKSSAMGGTMNLNGVYNTQNPDKPTFDLKYDLSKIQFSQMYKSIISFQLLAPIAQYIEGIFNTSFVASGSLKKDMMPDFSTINVNGLIETINGIVRGFKPVESIADKLNLKEFKSISLENTKNWFQVENGAVSVKEFQKKIADVDMKVSGTHQISGPMDYKFVFKIPREKLNKIPDGGVVDKGIGFLNSLSTQTGIPISVGEYINIAVGLKGSIANPDIKFNLLGSDGNSTQNVVQQTLDDVKKKAEDSLRTLAEQELKKAKDKAMVEAKRVEDSLRRVANEKIKEAEQKVVDQAKKEAGKFVDTSLINKGKDVLNDKAGKVLNESTKEEIEKAKEKLKNWDPFKKKK
ncbi:MAG TPA: AsmA-like C-terminal region-containing protein [Saprospiraceae bacterium]|nr:AsmA-like C-terminal region-containing protein [Saprospiraceae bacterium]